MSSVYRLLCLNHDPAIMLDRDYQSGPDAMDAAANPDRIEGHETCDLLVGRWSGGLAEIGCPPSPRERQRHAQCCHRGPQWTDVDWLRLLVAALRLVGDDLTVKTALEPFRSPYRCWTSTRMERLRSVL